MGAMTGRQWKSYVRLLLMALRDVRDEPDAKKKQEKLDEMILNLQKALED